MSFQLHGLHITSESEKRSRSREIRIRMICYDNIESFLSIASSLVSHEVTGYLLFRIGWNNGGAQSAVR